MSSEERPAEPGELCTCGRQAVVVYSSEKFGDVGYCGIEGAASRAVLPCPWCGAGEPHKQSWGDPRPCPDYRLRADEDAGKKPWTVGRLRQALAEHPDDTPLRVAVSDPDYPDEIADWDHIVTGAERGRERSNDGQITPTPYLIIESYPMHAGEMTREDT